MKRLTIILAAAGLFLASAAARADTALAFVTPQNIKGSTFKLTSKAARSHTVEFVIVRDVRNIDGPGTSAYLSTPKDKSIGTPVKLEEKDKTLTFRFSLPEDQVSENVFTLLGHGRLGEGITYEFHLADFWKPKQP